MRYSISGVVTNLSSGKQPQGGASHPQ